MKKCEAKYGDRYCDAPATKTVASQGILFSVCDKCYKLVNKQNKLNNYE